MLSFITVIEGPLLVQRVFGKKLNTGEIANKVEIKRRQKYDTCIDKLDPGTLVNDYGNRKHFVVLEEMKDNDFGWESEDWQVDFQRKGRIMIRRKLLM